MKKTLFCLLASLTFFVAPSLHAQQTFGAVLSSSNEVPPNNSPAFGNATVTLSADHTTITVSMTVSGLTAAVTGAHIHGRAAAGSNAGVLLDLVPSANLSAGRLNATYTIPKTLGDQIALDPQLYYINVHTTTFPGGEIRGQLTANTGTATSWAGELRGSNEVPPNSSTAVGAFWVSLDVNNNLTYEVHAGNLANITASHIHRGAAGVNGPIVINLVPTGTSFNQGRLRGTIAVTDAALADEIRGTPGNFYVNVHTTPFPGGEIRGQLVTAQETDIAVTGRVVGASATFVTDVRIFNPSFTTPAVALLHYHPAGATSSAAAATMVVTIAPRGTAVLDDVNGASFLNSTGTTGGLRITSLNPLVVTSRIFSDFRSTTGGTFGQFVQGVSRASALRRGVLPQLTHAVGVVPGSRTNVGFFNPNPVDVTIRLELREPAGQLLGTTTITLGAFGQQQQSLSGYFPTLTAVINNATLSFDASAPVLGYASIVDNATSDPTFIAAQEDIGVSTSP